MGGDLMVTRHFNMIVKRAIGFVDVNAVQLVADAGTYRIFRHDHAEADGVRAVRFRTADSEFWLEYRCDTTGFSDAIAKRTRESVQIRWARWPDALNEFDRGSYLIDATPGSDSGFSDAGVALGESITLGDVVISPLTIGGSLPREYIDVRIEVPALIAVQPSSREVAPGGSATFEVTASNANSTYQWFQYGEPIAGATSPRLAIADARSNDAAAYFVVVTSGSASVASRDAILRVGGYHGPILVRQPSYFPVPSTTNAWASLTAIARGDPRGARQWWHDGIARVGAYDIGAGFPLDHNSIGLHYATNTNAHGTITSRPAIVGIMNSARIEGAGREFQGDIRHPNGNIYDQMLLTGAGMSVQADPGQIVRISYVDLTNDIVQVEFSGAGTLNLRLDEATGPAPAENYRQPEVNYMRGHGAVIITGADENTHLSIFSVGSATAVNPALFREDVTYDGFADLAYVAIHSRTNRFGGLRVANTNFWHTRGFTGVYAPDIEFAGPVWVGDIHAHDAATPVLILGSSQDVRITGGDLLQPNGRPVQVDGMAQLQFTDGTTSHGKLMPAQTSRARLERDEIDVTTQMTQ